MKKEILPLIIGGKKIKTKKILSMKNPSTEKSLDKFYVAGQKEIDLSINVARKAQEKWKETSISKRIKLFKRLEKNIIKESDELIRLSILETGKPHAVALMDINTWLDIIDHYCKTSKKLLAIKKFPKQGDPIQGFYKNYIIHEPFGVIGVLVPWNWPIDIAAFSMVPAIMAGNAILYKPSEYTGYLGYKITELYNKSGFPAGLISLLNGSGAETGNLITKSKVDKIIFTGSTRAGKIVAQNCADNLTPVTLELGGLDAMIVLDDANIEEAVNGAIFGNFINSGHTCEAPKKIYVQQSIYKKFIELVLIRVKKLRVGPSEKDIVDIGSIAHQKQFDKINNFVDDAVSKGAKLEYGGKRIGKKGYFYSPTVLTNIKPNMLLFCEEPFGPIMPIISFKNENDVIKKANSTSYGLGASVWSRNLKRADKIAKQLHVGIVWINEIIRIFPQLPFGGIKSSGIGRELGEEGISEYVYPRSVIKRIGKSKTRSWWFPFDEKMIKMLKLFFFGFMHGHNLFKKIFVSIKLLPHLFYRKRAYKKYSKKI